MSAASDKPAALAAHQQLDWCSKEITALLEQALAEDVGSGDLTSDAVFPEPTEAVGRFLARQVLVVAGLPLVEQLFELLDPSTRFQPLVEEGTLVGRSLLAEVRGDARALLRGERTALNLLQRLCGIATLTRRFVHRLEGTRTRLLDTRKTTPGLRQLERYAVRVGGGSNHRFGLYDAVLIKENHAQLTGGVGEAVRRAREKYGRQQSIEAEVRDEIEVRQALDAGADILLLDNMSPEQIRDCLAIIQRRARVEVSGGITLENLREYAELGVDAISVGALTHSAAAADISFDVRPAAEPDS
ncbi:MAG: carboxylating nicotinate-nucleotide diphosphorylase [Acidobacteria bacterium]|nr:carboxylating nicotinate-nucleotide diphosphorylase [Acidobacteriota bacterium]